MNFPQKILQKYICNACDYNTCSLKDFNKHLLTGKHANRTKSNVLEQKILENPKKYICKNCNKFYKVRNSLWYHEQKCKGNSKEENKETDNSLIEFLINENKELKNMVMEVCKQIQPNITNNTINSNSNNKTFNLQVFLNETCKDAMNISDFIESVKLQVSDLENVGKVGYIEGIANIIIKNLNALDVEKRPVHCTDQKREVMYVKDENVWEKEDESNQKIRKAIRAIAHKNICMLKEFREKYPDCQEYDSKKSSQYNKIVIEAMGGKGDDDYEKNTKIIKKIAKAVVIDKKSE